MKKIFGVSLLVGSSIVMAQTPPEFVSYGQLGSTAQVGGLNPSGTLNQLTSFIANQLANNRNVKNVSDSRIAVASFVDIDNLGHASLLGMQVAENLMHEMHIRGFGIVDFKTRDALKVGSTGDLVFSRDIAELRKEYSIHYFLSGTITLNTDGAVFNARLIDAESSLIVSTAQGFLSKRELHRILNGEKTYVERPVIPALVPYKVFLK